MSRSRAVLRVVAVSLGTAVAMTALDLAWLGVVARERYDAALGPLKRPAILWPAAAIFYVFYVSAIVALAVVPAASRQRAAGRGAVLGGVAYGTYELTNWAVIAGWPAELVPIDLAWGIALTACASFVGRSVWQAFR